MAIAVKDAREAGVVGAKIVPDRDPAFAAVVAGAIGGEVNVVGKFKVDAGIAVSVVDIRRQLSEFVGSSNKVRVAGRAAAATCSRPGLRRDMLRRPYRHTKDGQKRK